VIDSGIISAVIASAGSGTAIIVILLLTGLLATRGYTQRIEKEAARATDHAGAEELRRAVVVQTQRADAAVEVAKLTKELLEDLRRRRDENQAG